MYRLEENNCILTYSPTLPLHYFDLAITFIISIEEGCENTKGRWRTFNHMKLEQAMVTLVLIFSQKANEFVGKKLNALLYQSL